MNILSVPVRAGEIAIIAENCKPIQIEQLRCSHGVPSATLPFAQGFGLASSWKLEIGAGSFNLDCLAFLGNFFQQDRLSRPAEELADKV